MSFVTRADAQNSLALLVAGDQQDPYESISDWRMPRSVPGLLLACCIQEDPAPMMHALFLLYHKRFSASLQPRSHDCIT